MKIVILACVLLGVVLTQKTDESRQAAFDERYRLNFSLTFKEASTYAVNCSVSAGAVCSDEVAECGNVYLCYPGSTTPAFAPCPTGFTCNNGACSATPSVLCEYGDTKFECSTEGMYPEPASCKNFNYCVPDGSGGLSKTQSTCEIGFGYNPSTTLCDKPLKNNVCAETDRAVPRCTTLGQNGALKSTPSLYYICLPSTGTSAVLYPEIRKCPGNQRYQGKFICK